MATTAPGRLLLAVDNLGLVFANLADGSILRAGPSGTTPTAIASKLDRVNAIAADGDGVYWTADDGSVGWPVR